MGIYLEWLHQSLTVLWAKHFFISGRFLSTFTVLTDDVARTEAPRLTQFHLMWILVQHSFGSGTKIHLTQIYHTPITA